VSAGDVLLELRTDEPARIAAARTDAAGAILLGPDAPAPGRLLIDRIA
jgi:thymidine phosphorylase